MKNYAKLSAAAFAGVMALSSMGINVFAEGGIHNGDTVTIPVTLSTDKGILPGANTTFDFVLSPASGYETPGYDVAVNKKMNGVKDAISLNKTSVAIDPTDTAADTEQNFESLTISQSTTTHFEYPGIYMYTLTQTSKNTTNGYKAIEFDTKTYTIAVTVQYDDNEKLNVVAYTISNGNQKVDDPKFTNTYDADPVIVKKVVEGNQGDKNPETTKFDFTFTIAGTPNKEFTYTVSSQEKKSATTDADGKATITAQLGHNQTVTVDNMTSDDTYTVSEDAGTYTPSVAITGNTATSSDSNSLTATALNIGNEEVIFTNTKKGDIPTGILMTAAPYAALVALGGIFAGLFFRRKKED